MADLRPTHERLAAELLKVAGVASSQGDPQVTTIMTALGIGPQKEGDQ